MFEEETPCFDPTNNLNSIPEAPEEEEVMGFPQITNGGGSTFAGDQPNMADHLEPHHHQTLTSFVTPEEEHPHYTNIDHAAHLIQEMMIQENPNNNILQFHNDIIQDQPTQDLLNLFHLPPPQFDPPIQFLPDGHHAANTTVMFDPLFHLNAQLTPHHHHSASPLMRELFQSLPHGCFAGDSPANTTLFGSCEDNNGVVGEGMGAAGLMMFPHHEDGDGRNKFEGSGVFDFGCRDMPAVVMGKRRERKGAKHYPTDREKRCQMNDRFSALKNLIPNPTKTDRASIVGDAIAYIQELIRSVKELELLVSRKRCGRREKSKRARIDGPSDSGEIESCVTKTPDDVADQSSYNSSTLRTSWLQRKSKVTEVDVRIIDDEVTIKLVQRKKINCLLYVSRVLDELQLDLHHVAGGQIGEHHSFLFNSKIDEGSSVYASAIASKLMEAVDAQYAIGNQVGNF